MSTHQPLDDSQREAPGTAATGIGVAAAHVPQVIDAILEHLSTDHPLNAFAFDTVEVEAESSGAWSVDLTTYWPKDDPKLTRRLGAPVKQTAAYRAAVARQGQQLDALAAAWGEPREVSVTDGSAQGLLNELLTYYTVDSARVFQREGHVVAIILDWIGSAGFGPLHQAAMILPDAVAGPNPHAASRYRLSTPGEEDLVLEGLSPFDATQRFREYSTPHGAPWDVDVINEVTGDRLSLRAEPEAAQRSGLGIEAGVAVIPEEKAWMSLAKRFFEYGARGLSEDLEWGEGELPAATARKKPADDDGDETTGAAEALQPGADSSDPQDAEEWNFLGGSWADSGAEDSTGDFCVFLEGRGADEAVEERERILAALERFGLERVEAREPGPDGAVWVRYTPELRATIDRWA